MICAAYSENIVNLCVCKYEQFLPNLSFLPVKSLIILTTQFLHGVV